MSTNELSYEEYNKKSYAVRGNKAKYEAQIKSIGGRWNPRMKDEAGWLVPKENINALKVIIDSVNNVNNSSSKLRKNQSKYHREESEDEKESDEYADKDREI